MAACPDECDLIVGIEDAAGFLGYGKADSFRRARTRHPIPGETGTSGGRPAWTARALLSWRSHGRRHRPAPENLTQDGGGAPSECTWGEHGKGIAPQ